MRSPRATRPIDLDQLAALPTPEPLIAGVLNRSSYAVLRGRDATFKTFLALDWALHLATGQPCHGHQVRQVRVLYIVGEGVHGFRKRVEAWQHRHGVEVDRSMLDLRTSAVNLYRGGPALERLIERVSSEGYGLVVIDTLNKASVGASANGSDMNLVLENVERIKRATGDGTVLVVAHTGKDDKDTRGFSGVEDDADIVYHAKRDNLARTVEVKNTKMKDGPDGGTFFLRADDVLDSLVLVPGEPGPALDVGPQNKGERLVLSEVAETPGVTRSELVIRLEETTRDKDERLARASTYRVAKQLVEDGELLEEGERLFVHEAEELSEEGTDVVEV